MSRKIPEFDKYALYFRSVQSPETDCGFLADTYRELRKRQARVIREDFCGTFAVCCEWVRRHRENRAHGLDLDPAPIAYGMENNATKLSTHQRSRIAIHNQSVLTADVPKADIIVALNFSYCLFKSRLMLRQYFTRALKGLRRDGIFVLDIFGGPSCQEPNIEKTKIGSFTYYWEQSTYDPITNEGLFQIHFKRRGEKIRRDVFTYDWRLWTIPEIRETMLEAGFKSSHVYWEGTTRSGAGDGNFKRREKGEVCETWIAYVVGES